MTGSDWLLPTARASRRAAGVRDHRRVELRAAALRFNAINFLRRAAAGALAFTAVAAAPAAAQFSPGSDGLGDPFFPFAGNGGYDVRHYSLDLDYVRTGNQMDATATISARATQNLSSFNLDLRGFNISNLEVDGVDAAFSRSETHELTVTPASGIEAGRRFVVRIEYEGSG